MTDVWGKQKRSEVMSRIRSHGNKATELKLIAIFRIYGITGWRRNQALIGNPDFTFRRERVTVFVDGCFWHGCPKCYRRPSSNQKYWDAKVDANRKRDRYVSRALRGLGWHVIRVWQHELANSESVAGRVLRALRQT